MSDHLYQKESFAYEDYRIYNFKNKINEKAGQQFMSNGLIEVYAYGLLSL